MARLASYCGFLELYLHPHQVSLSSGRCLLGTQATLWLRRLMTQKHVKTRHFHSFFPIFWMVSLSLLSHDVPPNIPPLSPEQREILIKSRHPPSTNLPKPRHTTIRPQSPLCIKTKSPFLMECYLIQSLCPLWIWNKPPSTSPTQATTNPPSGLPRCPWRIEMLILYSHC